MPIDFKIAWRNIWRNPRRSILTISAIAFACVLLVFMLSWQLGSYDSMINFATRIHTGHLQVQAKGYEDKQDIRLAVTNPDAVASALESTPGVLAYTFRAKAFSLASSEERTYGILVIGIDPARETQVSTIKDLIRRGSYLSHDDTNEALIGELLAKNLHVDLGDEVVLLGQGRDGAIAATVVQIKGVYGSGQDDFDRSSLQIPLKSFQDVYAMGASVHAVVALVTALDDLERVKRAMTDRIEKTDRERRLVVLDWMELMPGLIQGIQMDLVSGLIFYFILIVVVAFSILNTFLMSVLERTREFGVLMAIGTTPRRLTRLLLLESTTMALLGIIIGIIAGGLITWYFQVHGIFISGASELMRQYGIPERMWPQLSLASLSIGPGAVLIICALTALYPALKVRRLRPVEAMGAV
jgi:putative ABC transport system permease protein